MSAVGLASAAGLPEYLTLPPEMRVQNADALTVEEYGEAEFPLKDGEEPPVQRGKHWSAGMLFAGLPDSIEDNDVWTRIKPALLRGGWTIAAEFDVNPYSATFHYQKNGKEAWGSLMLAAASDLRLELVELKPQSIKFALKVPAAQPEKISPGSGDFPYLGPLLGSKFKSGSADEGPMLVVLEGSEEPQLVAPGTILKNYADPGGLSNVQFITVYRDALTAAGWKIVSASQGLHQSDAVLVAHYAGNGRNIWASLHHGGDEYSIQVGDATVDNLAAQLARDCHVPLYGVLFDFNKATLKAESDPVLTKARDALKSKPDIVIEVQGHTDNVGGDDYNQKLSEARAGAVAQWLTAHGIAAAQLTSKGYGRSKPVASNDTDQGRARNRRVELACRR